MAGQIQCPKVEDVPLPGQLLLPLVLVISGPNEWLLELSCLSSLLEQVIQLLEGLSARLRDDKPHENEA